MVNKDTERDITYIDGRERSVSETLADLKAAIDEIPVVRAELERQIAKIDAPHCTWCGEELPLDPEYEPDWEDDSDGRFRHLVMFAFRVCKGCGTIHREQVWAR